MVALTGLTSRQAVDDALDEFDDIGREAFLKKYGFRDARDYFLVTERGSYDSKAVFAAAYQNQHGVSLSPADFSGGKHGAAGRLADLGYDIPGVSDTNGRRTFTSFKAAALEFGLPTENLRTVQDFIAERDFQEFYIPPSRSYIGLVPRTGGRIPTVRDGYIEYRTPEGKETWIGLPVNKFRDAESGASRRTREDEGSPCPTCGLLLPASGVCPYCS